MALEFLRPVADAVKFVKDTAIAITTGVADAGKIVGTDANGLIDPSFFPPGVGAPTVVGVAGEALTAGDYVYFEDNGGTPTAFVADASATTTIAKGFVEETYALNDPIVIQLNAINTDIPVAAADVGKIAYLGATGDITYTPPTLTIGSGAVCQDVGVATPTGIYSNSHAMITAVITA